MNFYSAVGWRLGLILGLLLAVAWASCGNTYCQFDSEKMRQAEIRSAGRFIEMTRMEVEKGESSAAKLADLIDAMIEESPALIYRKVEQGGFVLGTYGVDGIPANYDDFFMYWPEISEPIPQD